jgi:hypothetical protein
MTLARVRQDLAWVDGVNILASEMKALDDKSVAMANGDGGGSYAPSSAVEIRGAGVWITGPWVLTGASAFAQNESGGGKRHTFGDNDYAELAVGHTDRTRSIICSFSAWVDTSGGTTQFVAEYGFVSPRARQVGGRMLLELDLHHGATIGQAVFRFAVRQAHPSANPPAVLPSFRVFAHDAQGNIIPLSTSGVAAGGFKSVPTPASGTAWYAAGLQQALTYACDAANVTPAVVVDRSKYSYWAEVSDESGANSLDLNEYFEVEVDLTTILDDRPQ